MLVQPIPILKVEVAKGLDSITEGGEVAMGMVEEEIST
jgi:hypothetical protein